MEKNDSGQLHTLWKRTERIEGKVENIENRVSALETNQQVQAYLNMSVEKTLTEMKVEQKDFRAEVQQELRQSNREQADRMQLLGEKLDGGMRTLVSRLDEVQYVKNSNTLDKIKWAALGSIIPIIIGYLFSIAFS